MKSILMSIRPEWVAKILNGEKTIEIRKRFPKDYVGWVYIYCTKDKQLTLRNERYILINGEKYHIDSPILNGKVVARFWCNGVEEIYNKLVHEITNDYSSSELPISTVAQMSCLTKEKLLNYVGDNGGYAIHITKLEIFDKPKEIKEFCKVGCEEYFTKHVFIDHPNFRPIYESELKQFQFTRAPQSWCYVEIGE